MRNILIKITLSQSMKKIITFLFLLLTLFVSAQQSGSIVINWNSKTEYSFGDYKVTIPQFQSDTYNYNNQSKSIEFVKKIQCPTFIDENSLAITNVVYETITETQLGDLNKNLINTNLSFTFKNVIARDVLYGLISLSPFIKDISG